MQQPDYKEISEKLLKDCENDLALKAARKEIYSDLVGSVRTIKSHRNADSPSDSIKACKEHLTLAGLYNLPQEHSVKVFNPPDLTRREEGGVANE